MLGCFPWDAIYKVRHNLKNQYNILHQKEGNSYSH
jgi:hypothetical protein